jgi:hypothetical protein
MLQSKVRALAVMLVLPALLLASGCSDDDSPTTPDTPSQAVIVVILRDAVIAPSPEAGFRLRLTARAALRETAGVGANINFVRLSILRRVGDPEVIEVQEVSPAEIVEQTGSNRLEANATRDLLVAFDYNSQPGAGILTYDFTDDLGNNLEADFVIDFGL